MEVNDLNESEHSLRKVELYSFEAQETKYMLCICVKLFTFEPFLLFEPNFISPESNEISQRDKGIIYFNCKFLKMHDHWKTETQ